MTSPSAVEREAAEITASFDKLLCRRTQIHVLINRLSEFLDHSVGQSFYELKVRLNKVEAVWDELQQLQLDIEKIDTSQEQVDVGITYQNLYFNTVGRATEIVDSNLGSRSASMHDVSTTQRSNSGRSSDSSTNLPAISLPSFSGSYEGWLQFIEIFRSIIDQNQKLSNIEKLYYLQSCLRGEASQILQSLEMLDSNYEVALSLLCERYENKKILVHNHVKSIFDMPLVTKESHLSLRKLIDNFTKNIRALRSLGETVDQWDTLLIHLIVTKLDFPTRKEWENYSSKRSPKVNDLMEYLKQKCQTLETLDTKMFDKNLTKTTNSFAKNLNFKGNEKTVSHVSTATLTGTANTNTKSNQCTFCKQTNHYTFKCQRLMNLPIKDRIQKLKSLSICTNCLKIGHKSENCNSSNCRVCGRPHNSILHDFEYKYSPERENKNISGNKEHLNAETSTPQSGNPSSEPAGGSLSQKPQVTLTSNVNFEDKQILLATATIYLHDSKNNLVKCRALLDSASQSHYCTKTLFNRLNLRSKEVNITVSGISQVSSKISHIFCTKIQSTNGSYSKMLQFLVTNKITTQLPQSSFDRVLLDIPSNITLADMDFNVSHEIDILLGTEIFFELLRNEKIVLGPGKPIIQNTKLGWILAGPIHNFKQNSQCNSGCFLTTTINESLEKFWKLETVDIKQNTLSNEELACEIDFIKNVRQDSTGKYIVKYPTKNNISQLGDSFETAYNRFLSLEKRLNQNQELKKYYVEFLKEYESMGHMIQVDRPPINSQDIYYYLPHHAIIKSNSTTSKVRVVFDGSCKTTSGLSLNDALMVGPKVQSDIFEIVLRMRTYPIVICADVEKMFRSILIHENQRNLQRIMWRENSNDSIKHYALQTVTYGGSSSPYLASRVLNEIGVRCKESFPKLSQIIINDFYMDDLITGATDINEAIYIKRQISKILTDSGFHLRKWMSNDKRLLENTEFKPETNNNFHIKSDDETKTLGISWDSVKDEFYFTYELNINQNAITKRAILSCIAKLFDPLGIINPVIVCAKLLMQQLWRDQLTWDEPVSKSIENQWRVFTNGLNHLNNVKVPRFVKILPNSKIELQGFSDSSENAYGACIYVRSWDTDGSITCNLLCSKSRIAPISSTSLPRLELCGALLLSQLMSKVVQSLRIPIEEITYWTDSEIVLAWLNEEPSKWKVFVSNRVAEIQNLSASGTWRHIDTKNNPADIVSRGAQPEDLAEMLLWWNGPKFLLNSKESWPETKIVQLTDIPEVRKTNLTLTYVSNTPNKGFLFDKWSNLSKLISITAYINRFIHNCKSKVHKTNKLTGLLSDNERDTALKLLCRLAQLETFSKEINLLNNKSQIQKDSKLLKLNPFLDRDNLLRVGGRLKNSLLTYDEKYQIILPSKHKFTDLVIRDYHFRFMHAGPQFILSQMRTKFWPLNGRNEIRKIIHRCLVCFRIKPTSVNQLMGALPKARVTPSRPFTHCGLDYAGPFYLKDGKTRSRITIKAYVCVFICMASRALHAELVSDLSAEGFLNAFKRFVARRGLCKFMYSDNATNFIGAKSELQKLSQIVSKISEQTNYRQYFSENRIIWNNIPPRSPHHGGIWESAVKSFKFHLKRVIGDTKFNFEQFYTILVQVESILNSRPILPLSEDPDSLQALTPGHFLIGDNLVAAPQENVSNIPTNRLNYFKHIQQIVQQFWSLWSKDYLNTLQQRGKWRTNSENIQIDDMVLLKDSNLPPMHWLLGRVEAVHPGADSLVRVVSVRTKNGVFKRAITQISPLPKE